MEDTKEKIEKLQEWISEKKGENIVVIDVRDKSSFTDHFVICSGNGQLHTKAIANHLVEKAREYNFYMMGVEGMDAAKWILLDLGDVIVHIFDAAIRDHYQLEDLWEKMPVRDNM